MQPSRMRSLGGGGGTKSIKDRLGLTARRGIGGRVRGRGGRQTGRGNTGTANFVRRTLQTQQLRGGGGGIKSRLGGAVRGGGASRITDARQRLNLSRVQKGRISDARQKIEERRRHTMPPAPIHRNNLSSPPGGPIKNLKITTVVGQRQGGGYMNTNLTSAGGASAMRSSSAGIFHSDMRDVFGQQPQMQQQYYHPSSAPPQQQGMFLTRTFNNPTAVNPYDHHHRSPLAGIAKVTPNAFRGYDTRSSHHQPMAMDEDDIIEVPQRHLISSSLQARLDMNSGGARHKIQVSNLQPSVTVDDIEELFGDIGDLISTKILKSGCAEVTFSNKSDCLKAVEAYHNRLLDGSPMRVFLENASAGGSSSSSSSLKSATGSTIKLPKSASTVKIQPDISAIHKVLFNPTTSSSTKGLFKQ